MVYVYRNVDGGAAAWQEKAKQWLSEQRHQHNECARHEQIDTNPRPHNAANAVPFVPADILGHHSADGAAHGDRWHLHIAPKLVHHAKCCSCIHAFTIDEANHHDGRARHDDHR